MGSESKDRLRELEALVRELDRAVLGHVQWLDAWHRNLVCNGREHTPSVEPDEAICQCEFGKWLRVQPPQRVQDHPTLTRLGDLHRLMHERAFDIVREWHDHRRVDTERYDAFLEVERQFARALLYFDGEAHEHLSAFDSLTGVMNRRAFVRVLAQEQARVNRTGEPCSLAILDLDGFKQINDGHGHGVGDRVLRAVARHLVEHLRPYDSISRYGGDEFLVVLPNTSLLAARAILDRLRAGIAALEIRTGDDSVIHPQASIGLSVLATETTIKQAVDQADKALYEAKRRGGNLLESWVAGKAMRAEG